ncbi:MAG: leucine-rich repeat domain-containing protein [Oscillospiraceae bacterium]|nr:leucine-rich repeat domain-containing protein [Oscillospiraceae bacterium]
MKIKKIFALLLTAVMLCGCSNKSREDELQSQIDDLRSQLENQDGKSSSNTDSVADNFDTPQLDSNNIFTIIDSIYNKLTIINTTYNGIDWDNIPEAPASDFGYRVFYGEIAEDSDQIAGYSGDGSEFIKSIFIFDYYGHDKNVKIPKEIDGLPVTVMGSLYGNGYYTSWNHLDSEWVEVQWDSSVFRDTGVENVFIPEHLRSICYTAFDDCSTLKSISVDPNNLSFFSEDGVLFVDAYVMRGTAYSNKLSVYSKLPQYTYLKSNSGELLDFDVQDRGETVKKTPACMFYDCYIDKRMDKFCLTSRVVKFMDGTYGAEDRVLGGYIPIEESQFKRAALPYLFRYPEGKSDESYTIKIRKLTKAFDEDGDEISDSTAWLYDPNGFVTRSFKNAQFLKELKFENGVTAMCNTIFYHRDDPSEIPIGIEKITVPVSLVSIGDYNSAREGYYGSFSYLTNLKEYSVDGNNPVFKSVDGALLSKDGKILYSMPGKIGVNYTVPDGVEAIASTAFANAQNMTITIPASVKYLGINSLESSKLEDYSNHPNRYVSGIFRDSSDITLNVSSKTEIRNIFESLPEQCESRGKCSNLTINFVD